MTFSYPVLTLSILHRDYPDVAGQIAQQIHSALPEQRLLDYGMLHHVIDHFKSVTEIDQVSWQQQKDRIVCVLSNDDHRLCKITEVREMLIAVVMKLYHPERLLGYETSRVKPGLVKALADEICCSRKLLSKNFVAAITRYKAYKGFKTEVDWLYERIKNSGEIL
ncbi:hypothetical protein GCM10023149_48690 [Mucilaginibacter gynuensis]|uniref:Uncharacterized protein n=2 Tax=Mucilaginibacter gynuensis TaxID=1302236 RepID=A0ABP8HFE0_9SPHI